MIKDIVKRLFNAFLISFLISMIYSFFGYQSTSGFEARQGMFIMVLVNFMMNIFNFLLSLTALLNLNENIRGNFVKSMLSFLLLPYTLLILLLVLFITGKNEHETFSDFLSIGLPSIVFCFALTNQFYSFRQSFQTNS